MLSYQLICFCDTLYSHHEDIWFAQIKKNTRNFSIKPKIVIKPNPPHDLDKNATTVILKNVSNGALKP